MNQFRLYLLYFLILVYISGSVGMVLNPSFFLPFTPYSLLLTSVVFLLFQDFKNPAYLLSFGSVAVLGFFSEWLGITTGLVFGNYRYGEALGFKLYAVPLCISLNWALLINAGLLVTSFWIKHRLFTPLISSLLITAVDLLIEQSASRLDFWYFGSGMAGIHNYVGWFLVSLSASLIFYKHLLKGNARIALLVLFLQILFFGTIFLSNGLTL